MKGTTTAMEGDVCQNQLLCFEFTVAHFVFRNVHFLLTIFYFTILKAYFLSYKIPLAHFGFRHSIVMT